MDFVEKLLQDSLDIPQSTSLSIERAHRPSGNGKENPRSIIGFTRFGTREDFLPSSAVTWWDIEY